MRLAVGPVATWAGDHGRVPDARYAGGDLVTAFQPKVSGPYHLSSMPNKDDLRSIRLEVRGQMLTVGPPLQGGGLPATHLSAVDAAAVYAAISRFGLSGFQLVPGGVRITSPDEATVITLTGNAWQFVYDLHRGSFEHAVETLGVTVSEFMAKMPAGTVLLGQFVDLQAVWPIPGGDSVAYISRRFVSDATVEEAASLAASMGATFKGCGVRLTFDRPIESPLPDVLQAEGEPRDAVDVRIEPHYVNTSQLFIHVIGTFNPGGTSAIADRTRQIYRVLWENVPAMLGEG